MSFFVTYPGDPHMEGYYENNETPLGAPPQQTDKQPDRESATSSKQVEINEGKIKAEQALELGNL